jgi:hypothetical protein
MSSSLYHFCEFWSYIFIMKLLLHLNNNYLTTDNELWSTCYNMEDVVYKLNWYNRTLHILFIKLNPQRSCYLFDTNQRTWTFSCLSHFIVLRLLLIYCSYIRADEFQLGVYLRPLRRQMDMLDRATENRDTCGTMNTLWIVLTFCHDGIFLSPRVFRLLFVHSVDECLDTVLDELHRVVSPKGTRWMRYQYSAMHLRI